MPFTTLEAFRNTYSGAIIHPHTAHFSARLDAAAVDDDEAFDSEDDLLRDSTQTTWTTSEKKTQANKDSGGKASCQSLSKCGGEHNRSACVERLN
jgi:hypothetical protein